MKAKFLHKKTKLIRVYEIVDCWRVHHNFLSSELGSIRFCFYQSLQDLMHLLIKVWLFV